MASGAVLSWTTGYFLVEIGIACRVVCRGLELYMPGHVRFEKKITKRSNFSTNNNRYAQRSIGQICSACGRRITVIAALRHRHAAPPLSQVKADSRSCPQAVVITLKCAYDKK